MNTCLKQVKKYVIKFLNKSFAPFSKNSKVLIKQYQMLLNKAASHNTYIETISNKADSLHRRINKIYEEDIINAFLRIIKQLAKNTSLTQVKLAIDITDEDFYGKTRNLWIHNWTGKDGVEGKFKYAVLSRVDKYRYPIMAIPLRIGYSKAEAISLLLEIANKLFKSIRLILLDRGFYSGEVFRILNKAKIKYIMFVPKNKAIKRYWENSLDTAKHEINYNIRKSTEKIKIDLILIKDNDIEWTFASNLKLENALSYIFLYKKRWQIETNFRVEDEANIKSKSVNYLVRYFYFMISLLLHLLWCIFSNKQFKLFIIQLYELCFYGSLGLDYCYQA